MIRLNGDSRDLQPKNQRHDYPFISGHGSAHIHGFAPGRNVIGVTFAG
jgi:hypothetical protein